VAGTWWLACVLGFWMLGCAAGGGAVRSDASGEAAPAADAQVAPSGGGQIEVIPPEEPDPLAATYQERATSDGDVRRAALFAVSVLRARSGDETTKLVGVREARSQVVAGTNYALVLAVTSAAGERLVAVTVHKRLDGSYASARSD
jgi:hypothetical protein